MNESGTEREKKNVTAQPTQTAQKQNEIVCHIDLPTIFIHKRNRNNSDLSTMIASLSLSLSISSHSLAYLLTHSPILLFLLIG